MRTWWVVLLAGCQVAGDKAVDTDVDTDRVGDTDVVTGFNPADARYWAHCAGVDQTWQGSEAWTGSLQATPTAVYCAMGDEVRTLEEDFAAKALLRVPQGSWHLPGEVGTAAMTLPACMTSASEGGGPVSAGEGAVIVRRVDGPDGRVTYAGEQSLEDAEDDWTFEYTLIAYGDAADPQVTLDGRDPVLSEQSGGTFDVRPGGTSRSSPELRRFVACDDAAWDRQVHHVVFEGGWVDLTMSVGFAFDLVQPGHFVAAKGELDGVPFEQDDYWLLAYHPTFHHFVRDFGVLFDQPMGAVCGLRIDDMPDDGLVDDVVVSTMGCDLQAIEVRAVTSSTRDP